MSEDSPMDQAPEGQAEELSPAIAAGSTSSDGNIGYEIFMAGLSILSIINLFLAIFVKEESLDYVITLTNLLLVLIFAGDFVYRMIKAPSKSTYFWKGYGWADLLSSLPLSQTNVLRLFRLIRVYRLMHDFGLRAVWRALVTDRAESALLTLLLIGMVVMEFGSLQMLRMEQFAEGANIKSASDAMWYVIVTMATVGYGDRFPVTNAGRLLGSFIIIVGVGIFGTLTGYLANLFLAPRRRKAAEVPVGLEAKFKELQELSAKQQQAIAELQELIERNQS